MSTGRLIVCATPIGNLGDVTARVVSALTEADVIAAEDTRVTRKLLAHHGISTPLKPYHAHNLDERTPQIVESIASGAVATRRIQGITPGSD